MKIKKGFILKQLNDDLNVVIAVGEAGSKINGYVKLTESAVILWKRLLSGATFEELVNVILAEYDIDEETAKKDVAIFIDMLKTIEALDE